MTDKTEAQPEALRLADRLDLYATGDEHQRDVEESADELRRLHAEIQQLKAQLSARQAAPDGWRLVPVEVVNLYDFMCLAFVPMTGQHEQIAISLKLAKAAMLSATPPQPEREPLTDEWHHNSRVESAAGIRDALSRTGVNLTITTILQLVDITRKAHGIGATND